MFSDSIFFSRSSPQPAPEGDYCLLETPESMSDFEMLEKEELETNIQSRRNKIFLLMEEVRRLRIQQRLKEDASSVPVPVRIETGSFKAESFKSALPFMPPISERTLADYYKYFASIVSATILFGGIVAPVLEVRLGLGGTTYKDFIHSVHLPEQLAQVDPIVASFCGGAVGVLSALLLVEVNNIKEHEAARCFYCIGTGYLNCGQCGGTGKGPIVVDGSAARGMRPYNGNGAACMCPNCSSTGRVMCTTCLCTGKQLATEHDVRLDPFF